MWVVKTVGSHGPGPTPCPEKELWILLAKGLVEPLPLGMLLRESLHQEPLAKALAFQSL
jgi:hypothetical protein